MPKFECQYSITAEELQQFKDFFLVSYVIIDDLYQQFVPAHITKRSRHDAMKLTDSEVITIGICGECLGIDSENAWYSFVKRNFSDLFPCLCSRSRFHRRRKNLLSVTALLQQKLKDCFGVSQSPYYIVDSFPLPVCEFGRAKFAKAFRSEGASYGICASKKETYFGYKVHALSTLDGYITHFEITPANVDDREGLKDLSTALSHACVLGDKGYVSAQLEQELQSSHICPLVLKRNNAKQNWSKECRQLIFKLRRRIETSFSQLAGQFNGERTTTKSFWGLQTRLLSKVLGHNLSMILNDILGFDDKIAQIKHLIF